MVLRFNICIDGPELSEGVAAQLEDTIYKPRLGFAEELKLFFGGKDKMVSFVDSYICSKKAIRNVILFQTEIQVYWVFGPGFLCKPACNLCQELWFWKAWTWSIKYLKEDLQKWRGEQILQADVKSKSSNPM